ncbi:MAG: OmpA family protein [Pseudomonadota bacterium]
MILRAALLSLLAGPVAALTLPLPDGAELTREVSVPEGARGVPTGIARDGEVPKTLAQGMISIQAYRVAGNPAPAALLAPLAARLEAEGYQTLLSCETESCGGFDFRFGLELIPPPHMFVDLGDFQVLSARTPDAGTHVSIVASRSQSDGYLHITRILPLGSAPSTVDTTAVAPSTPAAPPRPMAAGDLATALDTEGHVVLEDLLFGSGTTNLPEGTYPSLTALAEYLSENPQIEIALVGHTDSSGDLDINVDISRQRAASARRALIARYGVNPAQVRAEGMGYLAPRASNLTPEGRELNRRVEAIVTSTRP